jgi:hypothetical protein
MHDPALARSLRSAATAIPLHMAAATPERLARADALRAHVMLTVIHAWGYAPAAELTDALDERRLALRARGRPRSHPARVSAL